MTEFSIFPNIYNQSPSKTTSRTALSPDKSSKEVMKRVFDVEFALTSSAKKSPLKKTAIISKQQEMDQKMTTMAENLLKMSLLESGKPVDSMKLSFHEQTIIKNDDDFDLDLLHLSYSKFMEYISEDKEYKYASNEEKIIFVLKCFENEDTQISLGSAIFLWDLLYKYKESLSDEEITQILEKVYYLLPFEYENKNFYLLIVFLEIITILGPNEISFSNIKIIASLLKDSSLELVQKSAYLALLNLEYPGFYALCYILNREFTDTPDFILNKLANSTQIQTLVVVPALLNDLSTPIDNKKKIQSLNALNRMYSLIAQGGGLPILIQLLKEGILDRVLIASCLRAAGPEGETILLKLLKNSNISKIKEAIISALAWRIHDTNPLEIRIEEFQVAEHYKQSPGTMCLYYGSLIPCAIEENKQENNYIAINSRDFIAALQRLLTIKYEKFQLVLREKNLKNNNLYNVKVNGIAKDLILTRLFDQNLHSSNTSKIISPEIIKGLISCLSDENPQIRDQAINSIGIIGLPEGLIAFDHLIKCLSDVEAQVRTTAAWSIGIIGINQGNKCLKLLDLLKDSYWKVRTASCIAIGNIGTGISEQAFPILTKILKDGSINKLIICETIVKLGVGGEQILIDILRGTKNNSFKLKASILESFALANVEKPTIDFVIEEIFKHARFCFNFKVFFIFKSFF